MGCKPLGYKAESAIASLHKICQNDSPASHLPCRSQRRSRVVRPITPGAASQAILHEPQRVPHKNQ